jgi:type IV pilus assembly protein PilE
VRSIRGLTLLEVMIVIAIVGIITAIAVPIYTGYAQRARRADAKTALEQFRASQEMRRTERGNYSNDLTELQTTWGVQANPVGLYNLQWAGGFTLNANSWTAEAAPFGGQATDGSLFINNLGQKWDGDGAFYPQGKWAK